MILEEQARRLLEETEQRIGQPLEVLRKHLLAQRDPTPFLWELITIHAASRTGKVSYEPFDGAPDIELRLPRREKVWIEAIHVRRPGADADDVFDQFRSWVWRALRDARVATDGMELESELKTGAKRVSVRVPRDNEYRRVLQTDRWKAFAQSLRESPSARAAWDVGDQWDVVIRARHTGSQHQVSFGPAGGLVERVDEHPVYKAIREKARDARDRKKDERDCRPLVLCIGATDFHGMTRPMGIPAVRIQQAVAAALIDASKESLAWRYNTLRACAGDDLQVKGARFISAVIVVGLEREFRVFEVERGRHAKVEIYANPEAEVPLSASALDALSALDFNQVTYQPEWRAWDRQPRTKDQAALNLARVRAQEGRVSFRQLPGGDYEIEVSSHLMLRLLAGDVPAKDLLGDGFMGRMLHTLGQGHRIEDARVEPGDAKTGEGDKVVIRIGIDWPGVVARPRAKERARRSADLSPESGRHRVRSWMSRLPILSRLLRPVA
jgi:hypothetical protein